MGSGHGYGAGQGAEGGAVGLGRPCPSLPSLLQDFLLTGPRKCPWVPGGRSSSPGSLAVTSRQTAKQDGGLQGPCDLGSVLRSGCGRCWKERVGEREKPGLGGRAGPALPGPDGWGWHGTQSARSEGRQARGRRCRGPPQRHRRPQVFALGRQGPRAFPGCTGPAGTSVLAGGDGSAYAGSQEART